MQDRSWTCCGTASKSAHCRVSTTGSKCADRCSSLGLESPKCTALISAGNCESATFKSPANRNGGLSSEAAKCKQGFRGRLTNSFRRGPNAISQTYIIAMAILITISNYSIFSAAAHTRIPPITDANVDHSGALHHFLAIPSPQLHMQHFERFSAGVKEQQERLVVRHDRLDPLHHLRRYRGGYNLKSKHYWASTLFTGIHGYFLGTLWLLGGAFGAVALYIRYHHVRKKAPQAQPFYKLSKVSIGDNKIKLAPMILATIFITLIICCCGVVCVGSQRFHSMAKKVERTLIIEGANNATRLIHIVTQMMGKMKVDIEPYDQGVAQRLDNTTLKLNKASVTLINIVHDHKNSLDATLLGLNFGVITLAIINTAFWTLGLAFLYLFPRLRRAFSMVFVLVWLLIFLNWVFFGITYSLSNFADDTCKALKEYQERPENTTLDDLLPCHNLAAGRKTIFKFRQQIYNYIEEINKEISKRNHRQRQLKRLNEESNEMVAKDIPQICNPFSGPPVYPPTNNNCKDGTISISSLPQLLSFFKCPPKPSTKINQTKSLECISTRQINIATAYISATQKLLNLLPDVENLTGCSFLVDTFAIILGKQCKPLKNSIRMVWVSMVLLSAITSLTMVLWLIQIWIVSKFKLSSLKCNGIIIPHDHSPLPS